MHFELKNVYFRMDSIRTMYIPVSQNGLIYYKNYSEAFPNVSGGIRDFAFINPVLNLEIILSSRDKKKRFLES